MAWKPLPTDYLDAIWSGSKKFNMTENDDGTVSFDDVTVYSQREKSFFGAKEANRMNEALNYIMVALNNGTDLYELFKAFADGQKDRLKEHIDFLCREADRYVEPAYKEAIEKFEQEQEVFFNEWFDRMKGQLSEDAAGHLQQEIDTVNENIETINGEIVTINENISTLDDTVKSSHKTFSNIEVTTDSFESDTTYEDFPFKADIPCVGVTEDYIPTVNFSMADATSGNFAPISVSDTDLVRIYASEVPAGNITIPNIFLVKGVNE